MTVGARHVGSVRDRQGVRRPGHRPRPAQRAAWPGRSGAAFVQTLRARRRAARTPIVIAHDMRDVLARPGRRVRRRARAAEGADVIDAGLGSTDLLYFASGSLDLPGAMFTASHNPAAVQRHQDVPGRGAADRAGHRPGRDPRPGPGHPGRRRRARPRRSRHGRAAATCSPSTPRTCARLVDLSGIRPLKVVVDAGNGMAGYTVPAVLGDAVLPALPLDIVPLYFELDGSFPNHEANPLEPANIVDLQEAVRRARRRPRAGLRRRRRPLLRGRRATASRSRRARSPRWWPRGSWPSTRAPRSSTT